MAAAVPLLRPEFAGAAAKTPLVMLAKPWDVALNPADFLVSEKLDGVRAVWDGSRLRFRSGRQIAAPSWFMAALPALALDGELWLGRHRFEALSGTVRKEVPVDAQWQQVRYMVFDLPGDARPFAQRAAHLAEWLPAAGQSWLQAVAQRRVADAASLQALLDETVKDGGEGLVLHRADALWMAGRSDAVRKLKAEPDAEAQVLGYQPGSGKYQGQMGALLLKTPEGLHFALGTGFSDAQRAQPPAIGSWVTYRYRDRTTNGVPRFASFVRVREAE
ncbi:MAG: DNA ligase [Rhodoferax sp.]|nr:DNA ligase [Rhodoferax sp.]